MRFSPYASDVTWLKTNRADCASSYSRGLMAFFFVVKTFIFRTIFFSFRSMAFLCVVLSATALMLLNEHAHGRPAAGGCDWKGQHYKLGEIKYTYDNCSGIECGIYGIEIFDYCLAGEGAF